MLIFWILVDVMSENEKKTDVAGADDLSKRVEEVIDKYINPQLLEHKGWIELVDVFPEERTATVRFRGECSGCMKVDDDLEQIVVPQIRHYIREIRHVEIDDSIDPGVWEQAKNLFTHKD